MAGAGADDAAVARSAPRGPVALWYMPQRSTLAWRWKADGIGALWERHGLYSSHLSNWRYILATHDAATAEPKRGRKPDPARPDRLRADKLERELAPTRNRLAQAEALIEAQTTSCAFVGLPNSEDFT